MNLGQKIRQARLDGQMTLKEAADRAKISLSYFSDIEHGRSTPSVDTLRNIAQALGKPVAFFLDNQVTASAEHKKSERIPSGAKKIVDSLARANHLDQEDFDIIADQVERLIEYATKKKRSRKPKKA